MNEFLLSAYNIWIVLWQIVKEHIKTRNKIRIRKNELEKFEVALKKNLHILEKTQWKLKN